MDCHFKQSPNQMLTRFLNANSSIIAFAFRPGLASTTQLIVGRETPHLVENSIPSAVHSDGNSIHVGSEVHLDQYLTDMAMQTTFITSCLL